LKTPPNHFRAIITFVNRLPSRSIFLQILLIGLISAFLAGSPIQIDAGHAMVEAHLALEAAAYAPAASSLGRVVEFYPWRSDLLLRAGKLSLEAGNPESAVQYLNQAAQSTPLPPDSLLALGDAYLASGNTQQALRTWQQIPDTSGYSDAILLRLLDLHRMEGSYTQVAEDLKSLLRLHPNEVGYYYQLGLLLAVLEPDASLAYLSQVAPYDSELAVKANDLMNRINTARLYEEPAYTSVSTGRWMGSADEWQLALLAFRQAVEQRPDYAEAWAYLGEALQQTDTSKGKSDNQTGLKELKAALEIDPGSIAGLVLMSIYWQRHGEDKAALEYLNRASSLEPDIPILQAELGRVTAKLGDLPLHKHITKCWAFYGTSLLPLLSCVISRQVHQVACPLPASCPAGTAEPAVFRPAWKNASALGDLLNAERSCAAPSP
jgi:tetratricopeptide (TPR) repeat protein